MLQPRPGVYMIENQADYMRYIGGATDVQMRIWKHRAELRHGRHRNHALQQAWDQYGEDNFTFMVIEYLNDLADLPGREQYYIDVFNALDVDGYNYRRAKGAGWQQIPSPLLNGIVDVERIQELRALIDRIRPPENHIQSATAPPPAPLAATGTRQG